MASYTTAYTKVKVAGRKPLAMIGVVIVFLAAFGALFASLGVSKVASPASAVDPIKIVACMFPDGSIVRSAYQASQTDDAYFDSQSKSAVSSGKSDVNNGLNWILIASGMDFDSVNEGIIGQEIEKAGTSLRPETTMTAEELKDKWNKGPQVSPFDRFGMAGTVFTSYNGEWKYYSVDACGSEGPVDLKEGAYYDDRMEPKSTWEDRSDSQDPRTIQHSKGEYTRFWFGFVTLLSNLVFWITKLIVTLTIAFINFSFSDITQLMGLDGILSGDGTNADRGLFGQLFDGIYTPFIVAVMAITGIKIFIDGVVKRQFRNAFGTAAISVGMFLLAIIVSVSPAFFVNLPNNTAIAVQAVMVKAFTGSMAGEEDICATNMGSAPTGIQEGTEGKDDQQLLEQISTNIRSSIGCTFWQTFVFKPWAEGQWGVNWNETWAKDKIPAWAPDGAKSLQNSNLNAEMVGDAAVPIGNGEVVNNWAVFNMSTLTNAHSPVGYEGNFSKFSQGVANDWWRVVDVLTNYEETALETPVSMKDSSSEKVEYTGPKGNPPLEQWDTWSGNNPGTRLAAAMSSLFIGAVGLIAPFVFGLMAAVYSLAMTIVMVFLPIMLLFGSWGGKGFNIFKQWASLLWSLFTKRIAVAFLLMMSIIFVNAAIVIMEKVGWWQGALMLMLLTFILIKSRHKIIDMLGASNAGSFASVASRIGQGISNTGKTVGGIAASGVVGGVYSKAKGGTVRDGMSAGLKSEFNNLSYRNPFLREVRTSLDQERQHQSGKNGGKLMAADGTETRNCASCSDEFLPNSIVKQGPDGMWYCNLCAEGDAEIEDGLEVLYRGPEQQDSTRNDAVSALTGDNGLGEMDRFGDTVNYRAPVKKTKGGKIERMFTMNDRGTASGTVQKIFNEDVAVIIDGVRSGRLSPESLKGSNIPTEIQKFLDPSTMEALVESQDWEAVATSLMAAYILAIEEEAHNKVAYLVDHIDENFEEILDQTLASIQMDPRTTMNVEIRSQASSSSDTPEPVSNPV